DRAGAHLHADLHLAAVQVPGTHQEVGEPAEAGLELVVGARDHRRVEADAGHDEERLVPARRAAGRWRDAGCSPGDRCAGRGGGLGETGFDAGLAGFAVTVGLAGLAVTVGLAGLAVLAGFAGLVVAAVDVVAAGPPVAPVLTVRTVATVATVPAVP